ncbi:MAG: OB-fold nucleic acid binding domain-containing protein, partial [Steroidobacterales bacterium]
RVLEALIRSGSLDGLGPNRATLMAGLTQAMQAGEQRARSVEAGQVDFFGLAAPQGEYEDAPLALQSEWPRSQRLAGERETLGLFLTGHPIEPFEADLRHFATGRIADFATERPVPEAPRPYAETRSVTLGGLILEVRRRGGRVSFVLDDRSGRMEVTLYDEVYQRHRELIVKDALVQVEGALRFDEFSDAWRLSARQIQSLDAVRERLARQLVLQWPSAADAEPLLTRLERILSQWRPGGCSVLLRCSGSGASGVVCLGADWKVQPSAQLLEQLEHLLGPGAIRLRYAPEGAGHSAASA